MSTHITISLEPYGTPPYNSFVFSRKKISKKYFVGALKIRLKHKTVDMR